MKRGYLALYRKIQDHEFYKEKRSFSKFEAWLDILMEVQHSLNEKDVVLGMKVFKCGYGQSLKSLRTWGLRWGWSGKKVSRYLNLLQNMDQICLENVTVTTRLTVLNYSKYDPKSHKIDTTSTQKGNSTDTVPTHDRPTDKNEKKVNNKKNIKEYSPEIKNFVRDYQNYVSETFKNLAPKITDSFLLKCCKTINQLITIDKFTFDQVFNSLQWASNDSFWSDQIKSLANVRVKGKNGEKKFVNMFTAYKKKDNKPLSKSEQIAKSNINSVKEFLDERRR